MLEKLKEAVLAANLELYAAGLAVYTWGNASGFDRESGLVVIKPSGVPYAELNAASMVVVDLMGGTVEGKLRPSSDLPTHLQLYRAFPKIGGVVHTHSTYATAWAQARKGIPCYGTTHADHFFRKIPCTRGLRRREIEGEYESNTGKVIVECFKGLEPLACPGVLVANHGPFAWGKDCHEAALHALILEEVAKIAALSVGLRPGLRTAPRPLIAKHHLRKHGDKAYYGQPPA